MAKVSQKASKTKKNYIKLLKNHALMIFIWVVLLTIIMNRLIYKYLLLFFTKRLNRTHPACERVNHSLLWPFKNINMLIEIREWFWYPSAIEYIFPSKAVRLISAQITTRVCSHYGEAFECWSIMRPIYTWSGIYFTYFFSWAAVNINSAHQDLDSLARGKAALRARFWRGCMRAAAFVIRTDRCAEAFERANCLCTFWLILLRCCNPWRSF